MSRRAARRTSLQAGRVAIFVLICATYFVGVLPPGVCFCELEGGSCCGPAPAWGPGEGDARDEPASPEDACCDGCGAKSGARAVGVGASHPEAPRAREASSDAEVGASGAPIPLT